MWWVKFAKKPTWILLGLFGLYFGLYLLRLEALPVFADEAIYIRWAQLIIDDWQRYLFYPMNDGKTPLQMWLMVPFLWMLEEQLWAARLLSVLAGAVAMAGVMRSGYLLTARRRTSYLIALLFICSPFIFFHQRLALTDAVLLAGLAWSQFFTLRLVQQGRRSDILKLGVVFFLSLFSKTPAILFTPILLSSLLIKQQAWPQLLRRSVYVGLGLLLGLVLLYSFRLVPLFSQLFAVGGGFLQSKEVLLSAALWPSIMANFRFISEQLLTYLGPAFLLLCLPLATRQRRSQIWLLLGSVAFLAFFLIFGRVLYPRYLLPVLLPLLLTVAITLHHWLDKAKLAWLIVLLLVLRSVSFIHSSYYDVDQLPLSPKDREQYLEEWSSGHGIREATALIKERAQARTVAVATEGFFGTLPDGILLNLHKADVSNIYVEGIGQPVRQIPATFKERAQDFEEVLLVVNSHRLLLELPPEQLLAKFCRPNSAPCLQVWQLAPSQL